MSDDFDLRIKLIEARLRSRHLGSKIKMPLYDFDAWVEEDLRWLLEAMLDRDQEADRIAEKAQEKFKKVEAEILEIPKAFTSTDTLISDTELKITKLSQGLQKAKVIVGQLRDELGLFDESSDIQLYASRKELIETRKKLEDEKVDHQSTRNLFQRQVEILEVEKAEAKEANKRLQARIKALQIKLDNLPPTWQERILSGCGDIPVWAEVGNHVRSPDGKVDGVIDRITFDTVVIKTSFGEVLCPLGELQDRWRGKPV